MPQIGDIYAKQGDFQNAFRFCHAERQQYERQLMAMHGTSKEAASSHGTKRADGNAADHSIIDQVTT